MRRQDVCADDFDVSCDVQVRTTAARGGPQERVHMGGFVSDPWTLLILGSLQAALHRVVEVPRPARGVHGRGRLPS